MSKKTVPTKSTKAASASSDTKTEKGIDFGKMSNSDIIKMDTEDPVILKELDMKPFPNFNDLPEEKQYVEYKKYYMKQLIIASITENNREKAFEKLKVLGSDIVKTV